MSIQRNPDGRRSVRVEAEVPGTPEQVWRAIATGPGISAWFVPTKVEERVGGEVTCDFGSGQLSTSKITAWNPPHRFAAEDKGWAPGMPPVATEWTVEAKAGGTCIVRVVHSLFASTDDWNGQLEGTEGGWATYFRVLRRYLQQFAGQQCAVVQAMAMTTAPTDIAWQRLTAACMVADPRAGQRALLQLDAGNRFAGAIDRVDAAAPNRSMLVHLEAPFAGTLLAGAYSCGGSMVSVQAYLYGARTVAAAGVLQQALQQWLTTQFPAEAQA